ncbi:hypothetical protein FMEAI12_3130037 [Parafrankia sp. Ea1.12]|nr:hypothetical protein FMEAI12_3130037 [Parafrankia sp. Ea1.12]
MRRTVYGPEHDAFRAAVRTFFEKEIGAHYREWEEAGLPPRDFYNKAGDVGILGLGIPEEYGGGGADFLFNAVVTEEAARGGYALGPCASTRTSPSRTSSTTATRSRRLGGCRAWPAASWSPRWR